MDNQVLTLYVPWGISVVTSLAIYLTGIKWRYAWLVAAVGTTMWGIWSITLHLWGLLPMNIIYLVLNAYNHWKWTRDSDA